MIARFKLSENSEKDKKEHQTSRFTYIDDEPESEATLRKLSRISLLPTKPI